ncbi:hypothetical protein BDV93DRAFT_445584 [Ceratobasidium sp. AG-I]|nr:hypothetical protein BDV93DRAFT_445584 [Ceratobasidium sp. AG-I]
MRPARERDEHDRNLFQWLVGTYYDARHLVFVDESAYDRWTTRREYAWAPSGDRARRRDFFVRGTRFSMLPALCLDGIIHCNIIPGSVTSAIFNDFVSGLLHEMNPFPAPRSVIVMDNASIHKSNALREMVEAR